MIVNGKYLGLSVDICSHSHEYLPVNRRIVHDGLEGSSSTTIPKPRGNQPSTYSGMHIGLYTI